MPYLNPEQQREYQRRWIAKRREQWFTSHGPCIDCGTWESLELDHVDPSLKITHNVWSWKQERREAELAKCVARCEECHAKRTVSQLHTRICINGHDKDITGYDNYGVTYGSCSECRRERHRREREDGKRK